jgi:superfamily II DNA helicase RecQ
VNPYIDVIERHAQRIKTQKKEVLALIRPSNHCLKQELSRYFGQELKSNCLQCSNCLRSQKNTTNYTSDRIAQMIMALLKDQSLTMDELKENINFASSDIEAILTYLHGEQKIGIDAVNRYFLK